MKEIVGNIWDYHKEGHWIVITTNGTIKTNGEAVMGKGIALQAKQRYPELPKMLGAMIKRDGNCVRCDGQHGLILFPTKHDWWEKSDLKLIETGLQELVTLFEEVIGSYIPPIYLVKPGCRNGQLDWKDVRLILEKYLDDRFIVVNLPTAES